MSSLKRSVMVCSIVYLGFLFESSLCVAGIPFGSKDRPQCALCGQFASGMSNYYQNKKPTYKCYVCHNCSITRHSSGLIEIDSFYVNRSVRYGCRSCFINKIGTQTLKNNTVVRELYDLGCDTTGDCCGFAQNVKRKCCSNECNLLSNYNLMPQHFIGQCYTVIITICTILAFIFFCLFPSLIFCIWVGGCENFR